MKRETIIVAAVATIETTKPCNIRIQVTHAYATHIITKSTVWNGVEKCVFAEGKRTRM